ncbi:HEPN domain-containing protein [Thermus tengchongensis]|uniref:HEPN domain-containing protein n=1 Tax=Thermus tengchongensis TaxID=1214928 RepID=UPI001F21638C|nr:HEPN domain-containing protein [Thermus tengchongensis]
MVPLDREEGERWLAQARHTLASGERDLEEGDYDWASFKAHQAGEYALKGLLRGLGRPAFGHALFRLLQALAETGLVIPPVLEERARLLDAHYIPARCPDAYPEGSPYEYYTPSRAKEALQAARSILGWVEEVWHGLEGP